MNVSIQESGESRWKGQSETIATQTNGTIHGSKEEVDNTIHPTKAQMGHLFWRKMLSTLLITSPVMMFGALGCSNFSTLSDQLIYIKMGGAMVNKTALGATNETCTLSLNKTGEDKAQSSTTDFQQYSRMGRCAASLVFIPVWGAFSDRHGRHTAVFVASSGAVVYAVSLLLVALVDIVPLWTVIVADVLHGILGSSSKTLMVACASFAADVFQEGDRTLIMIMFDLVFLLSYTLGQVGGGFWIKASGFVPVIICMLVLNVGVVLYGLASHSLWTKSSIAMDSHPSKTTKLDILNYFSKSYKIFIKPRTGFNRTYLVLMMFLVGFMHFSIYGVDAVFTVYTIGPPLCWSSVLLGIYKGARAAANAVVPLVFGFIFLKCSVKATAWLVFIGLLSDLVNVIIFGLAKTDALMFAGLAAGSCSLIVASAARAIIADLVEPDEQGAALAGYFLSAVIAEFLCSPLFNAIFVSTIKFCNSCFFFAAASFDIVSLVLLGIYGCIRLIDRRQHYKLLLNSEVKEEYHTREEQ